MADDSSLNPNDPVLKEALQNLVGDVVLIRGSFANLKFTSSATASGTYWKLNSDGSYLLDPSGLVLPPEMVVSTDYSVVARIPATNINGSGAVTFDFTGVTVNTHNTGTSSAAADWQVNGGSFKLYANNPKLSGSVSLQNTMTTNGDVVFFGMGAITVTGTDIDMTSKHIGFKIKKVAGAINLYATQSDGVTEDVSGILTTVASGDGLDFIVNHTSDTKTDFYWRKNGSSISSVTTLNTKVPASSTTENIVRLAASNATNSESVIFNASGATYRR